MKIQYDILLNNGVLETTERIKDCDFDKYNIDKVTLLPKLDDKWILLPLLSTNSGKSYIKRKKI